MIADTRSVARLIQRTDNQRKQLDEHQARLDRIESALREFLNEVAHSPFFAAEYARQILDRE